MATKPTTWYISFEDTIYPRRQQCSLAWMNFWSMLRFCELLETKATEFSFYDLLGFPEQGV
jgi:hypothetical protein